MNHAACNTMGTKTRQDEKYRYPRPLWLLRPAIIYHIRLGDAMHAAETLAREMGCGREVFVRLR